MRHLAREGVVELDVLIDPVGKVRQVTIIQSAGIEFDQAVQTAIMASTFAPGEVNGKPVTTLLRLPVKFRLQ
jgi:TonB family protein